MLVSARIKNVRSYFSEERQSFVLRKKQFKIINTILCGEKVVLAALDVSKYLINNFVRMKIYK